ncbi:MAG: alpha-mannosidase [Thermoprotei archaeon]
MQRTSQEIEARLNAILASSFVNWKRLSWKEEGKSVYRLDVSVKALPEKVSAALLVKDYSGSALVLLNGKPFYSLDGYHNYIPLAEGENNLEARFSPYKAFGEIVKVDPGTPYYVELAEEPYTLYTYLFQLNDMCNYIQDDEVRADGKKLISETLSIAYFDSVSPDQAMLASSLTKTNIFQSLQTGQYDVDLSTIGYRSKQDLSRYSRALSHLRAGLSSLRNKYGKRGEMLVVAHAHIDSAWLWPFDETRRKVARTFSTVTSLMDKYDFVYLQSMALYYKWIKEDFPELFERIKEKVAQGKWLLGAGWVETDGNMISGESFARHFLYSQRLYLNEFGKTADILWLPDTFGFAGSIPGIARLGGAKLFATQKVFWNDTNKFPYTYFNWVGIDGTSIPAIAFGNGRNGYNGTFDAREVLEKWRNNADKDKPLLYTYGYGDGGGGPTPEMFTKAQAVDEMPLLPKVRHGLSDLGPFSETWRGELYLETHRGTLTSHSLMKYLHAKAEVALREAELWAAIAGNDADFESLWEILLKDEFHDVLPGSAIRPVYEEVYAELRQVIDKANEIAQRSRSILAGEGEFPLVFNSLNWEREDYVEVDSDLFGNGQRLRNGKYLVKVRAPSVGYAELSPVQPAQSAEVREEDEKLELENGFFRLSISKRDGSFDVYDKEVNRKTVTRGNYFVFYENMPGWADAWDIEPAYKTTSFALRLEGLSVEEKGPLRASVKLTFSFRNSRIEERIEVSADRRLVDLYVKPIMRDRELLLKVWFDADVNSTKATYEIPFGNLERPTTKNSSWEKARFEVPMLRWADISDGGYGFAIIAEAKHGISAENSSLGLSLSKTPIYPDPLTDVEDVETRISIYPHIGGWKDAKVHRAAYEVAYPLTVSKGKRGRESYVSVDDEGVILEAIKKGEDGGIVLRLYDAYDRKGITNVTISPKLKFSRASITDLIELNQLDKDVKVQGSGVQFEHGNFEIVTLLLR